MVVADLAGSLRLDGSRVDTAAVRALLRDPDDPSAGVADAALADIAGTDGSSNGDGPRPRADRRTSWLDAMADLLDEDAPDAVVVAREVAGLLAAWSHDGGLATAETPATLRAALADLHDRLTPGLVAAADSGVLRRSTQVVHDAATGRVLHYPPDADRLPARLGALLHAWSEGLVDVAGGPAGAIERAAVLHQQLALLHPFESANGRLARTVARHVLLDGGVAPAGLDAALARDAVGYWEQMTADARRGSAARTVEVLAEHLLAARAAGATAAVEDGVGLERDVDVDAMSELDRSFTVADARDRLGTDLDTTLVHLVHAALAGVVTPVVATSGLRWTRLVVDPPTEG